MKKLLFNFALLLAIAQGAWAWSGSGTEGSPYQIATTADWNTLVTNVNGGTTYSGTYFKMTANVGTVSTWMTGTFSGTFDGDGYTLTVGYNTSATYCAPFGTLNGATIKNLIVAGNITTSSSKAACIAWTTQGTTYITKCIVRATLNCTATGDASSAGFVAQTATNGASLYITDCAFTGSLTGSGATYVQGFVDYNYSGHTLSFTRCLFAPASVTVNTTDSHPFTRFTPTLNTCYYTHQMGSAQGTDGSGMTAAQLAEALGPDWHVWDGKAVPMARYEIGTTTDWNNLVSAVNGGETYSGTYFKMTANVGTVSTWMTGTFSGTFDGDGKTLTVGYNSSVQKCAPFGKLSGATIQNLKVAGSITTSAKYAAGIAGEIVASSTVNITNCLVSVTINSSVDGDGTHGGFIAVVSSYGQPTITGCVFDGKLLTSNNTTCCGGFVGWPDGTTTIRNSLFAPSQVNVGTTNSATFARNDSWLTLDNCYYTQTLGTAQGKQARTIAAGDYVTTLTVNKGDATATYDVSGITVYSGKGIDYNDGSTTTFYSGSGDAVPLSLAHADATAGQHFANYSVTGGGTLSDNTSNTPTLTMTDANQTISAQYADNPTHSASFATGSGTGGTWTITPSSTPREGETVTVSYTGDHKVKSVTVTNKYAIAHSLATAVVGDIVGSDGNAYSVAEKNKLPVGVSAAGVVTYKSGANGIVVALQNLATMYTWSDASTAAAAYTPAVSGQTWKLGTKDELTNALTEDYTTKYGYITAAGGTFPYGVNIWSATEYEDNPTNLAWRIFVSSNGGTPAWHYYNGVTKDYNCHVRPIIAF